MLRGRFEITATALDGVWRLERLPIHDDRGWLERVHCGTDLADLLQGRAIEQVNRTLTHRVGAVRGLHYQRPPAAETKIVSCLRGAIFDVAVDLRSDSGTFLQWHGEILSSENRRTLFVPEGFAHGFQALEEDSEVLYLVTASWDPAAEGALNATDPRIGVAWPRPITQRSQRDEAHPYLTDAFRGLTL